MNLRCFVALVGMALTAGSAAANGELLEAEVLTPNAQVTMLQGDIRLFDVGQRFEKISFGPGKTATAAPQGEGTGKVTITANEPGFVAMLFLNSAGEAVARIELTVLPGAAWGRSVVRVTRGDEHVDYLCNNWSGCDAPEKKLPPVLLAPTPSIPGVIQ